MSRHLLLIIALSMGLTLHARTQEETNSAVARFRTFYNDSRTDSIFNMFSDRIKALMPAEKTTQMMAQLTGKLGRFQSFEFIKEEGPASYYKCSFTNGELTLIMSLSKDHKLESFRFIPYVAGSAPAGPSNFSYQGPAGTIYGTLTLPAAAGKVPVVLIIAGSGPTDRNCNQGGMATNSYQMLADSLQQHGIACLRYDKRGVGASIGAMKDEESTRFGDNAGDAAGIIKMLKKDDRFAKVIILGHSEGSLVGMIAAQQEKADGFISLAGAGESAGNILLQQLAARAPALVQRAKTITDSMSKGYTVTNIDTDMMEYFRPSVQPYLRSWFRYDPAAEIRKLALPILLLQGTTDIQVSVSEAELLKKASPKAMLHLVKGMNHVLKQAPADTQQNIATYTNPALPLSAGLMPPIYTFINQIK